MTVHYRSRCRDCGAWHTTTVGPPASKWTSLCWPCLQYEL